MRIVTYNIQYGLGKDGLFDVARIADSVRGADIIALQEVERHMPRSQERDLPAELQKLLPEYFAIYGPTLDLDASKVLSDGKVTNRRCQLGNMILSRWPILSSRLHLLPKFRTLNQSTAQRGALEGVIETPIGPLRVYAVHLSHLLAAERLAQLDYLMPRLFELPNEGGVWTGPEGDFKAPPMPAPFVIMGDFNFSPGSPEYLRVVGEADYYYGRCIVGHQLVDSWTQSGHDTMEGITWHDIEEQKSPGLRLDYGFVSPDLAEKVKSARIDDQAEGSDHQPYWFELEF